MILPKLTSMALAALLYTSGAQARHWDPKQHFNIDLARYADTECAPSAKIGKETHIRGFGDCTSWEDGEAFSGFAYGWSDHGHCGEEPGDFGNCEIHVWEDDSCSGRLMGGIPKANDRDILGLCQYGLVDDFGRPGLGKTLQLVCDK